MKKNRHLQHARSLPVLLRGVLLFVVCCAAGRFAPAQPLDSLSLDAVTAASTVVLVGTVTAIHTVEPENPYANSEANVQVEETMKGAAAATIAVRYPGPLPDVPARGNASVDALPQFILRAGDRKIFLLEGGAPFKLSHLRQGILPVEMLPQIHATLNATPFATRVTTDAMALRPAQSFVATIHFRNVSDRAQIVRLPREYSESTRLACWCNTSLFPGSPVRWSPVIDEPSTYIAISLQPGEERAWNIALTTAPTARLTSPQHVNLAAWVYILPADSEVPCCIASPPLELIVSPGR